MVVVDHHMCCVMMFVLADDPTVNDACCPNKQCDVSNYSEGHGLTRAGLAHTLRPHCKAQAPQTQLLLHQGQGVADSDADAPPPLFSPLHPSNNCAPTYLSSGTALKRLKVPTPVPALGARGAFSDVRQSDPSQDVDLLLLLLLVSGTAGSDDWPPSISDIVLLLQFYLEDCN